MDPSEWHALGAAQYQRHHLFDMSSAWREEIAAIGELKDFEIVPAQYGGPVAIIRKAQMLVKMDAKGSLTRTLFIFNACGTKLASISFKEFDEKKKTLLGMAWTDEMRLLCVFDDGNCVTYSVMGDVENTFNIVSKNLNTKILSFESWGGGIACLLGNFMVVQVMDIDSVQPRIDLIVETGISEVNPPTCMAVLNPRFVKTNMPEILLGTTSKSLVVLSKGLSSNSKDSVVDMQLQESINAPISAIAIAPNGKFMAIYTQDGVLTVLNTAFDKKILTFETSSKSTPKSMLWCGEDSVILYWQNLGLIMVGPYGSWLKFPCDGPVELCQEVDSCRIYSSRSHELLMRVPTATENIKRIGSTSPAAMLFDALDAFDSGDAKADENIRSIQVHNTLEHAITDCINAAGNEFDYTAQSALLRAASYGKCFLDNSTNPESKSSNYDSELFVDMCRKLRVLNALRKPNVGLPLTLTQFDRLTSDVVVSRLVAMRQHFLASKICEYLKISPDRVLVHWACEKVKTSFGDNLNATNLTPTTDEGIVALVRKRLKDATLVSYSEIASCAERAGRRRLATMLLDLEENASDQVPLLLSMGECELALRKALESSQTDLIYMAIFHMERLVPAEDFRRVLQSEPMYQDAIHLLTSYYIATEEPDEKLDAIWSDTSSANYDVLKSFQEPDVELKLKRLKEATNKFNNAKLPINAKLTEEQMDLLAEQKKLDDKALCTNKYVGLSLSDTIKQLCMDAKRDPKSLQLAAGLSKKFKVPEKRFYHVKIKALAETQQWEALHKFSQEKKNPPCGFKAFAVACLKEGEKGQAESYAARITQPDEKFDTFIHLQMWPAALELAVKLKDPEKLSMVRNNCQSAEIQMQVDQAAQQLGFI
ncbi:vacuolar protein sorting-associated protein [Thraustotheca clavata]|uniref:Vacuolar protein sorting-associated protein n=1 Tax=Thraustotheca clavata TaxID=74557 RepID=A0A1V9ZYF1_9STRA|nr:vacuolar protein sorting-associated protein [Thraustotheca clavata]